ncbi:ATP-binding protein [Rheinheimera sp.]|uniref:sensor histidine kinase n=1 Tax=Rheinheimera sp. TaxID=1869214 RepID=UPI00307CD5FB
MMPQFRLLPFKATNQSLGARMVSAVLVWTLVTAVLITALQLSIYYQNARQQAEQRLVEIEQVFVPMLSEALWTIDETRIQSQLQSLQRLPEVNGLTLRDELGRQLRLQKTPDDDVLNQRHYQLYYTDVDSQQRHKVGELEVQLSSEAVTAQIQGYAVAVAVSTLTSMVLGALLLWWLFHHWISKHLDQVANYAAHLDLNQPEHELKLDREPPKKPDELDLVVQAINQMQHRITQEFTQREQVEHELRRHQHHLEQLVTERTQLLQQKTELLQRQSQELEEQNAELNAYAHTVAHDLKHPLTSLIGASTLLSQPELTLQLEQQKQFLLQIKNSAMKMNDIINALLQLASIRSEQQLETSVVDMQQSAQEAMQRLADFASQENACLSLTAELPSCVGHSQWLEEVWVNYLSNAIKYAGPSARIELGATAAGSQVKYWVRDYGSGVPAEKVADLFTEFNQFQSSAHSSHGLGLSIVKRIMLKLKGDAGYESAPGGGSLFWFSLPKA